MTYTVNMVIQSGRCRRRWPVSGTGSAPRDTPHTTLTLHTQTATHGRMKAATVAAGDWDCGLATATDNATDDANGAMDVTAAPTRVRMLSWRGLRRDDHTKVQLQAV